jgi:hypothetical protein
LFRRGRFGFHHDGLSPTSVLDNHVIITEERYASL